MGNYKSKTYSFLVVKNNEALCGAVLFNLREDIIMTANFTQNLLQKALFQAAKVGHIKLMREFIAAGANPFELDEKEHNAIFYADLADPENTAALLLALEGKKEDG